MIIDSCNHIHDSVKDGEVPSSPGPGVIMCSLATHDGEIQWTGAQSMRPLHMLIQACLTPSHLRARW